jgi:hypothetical protein
MSRQETETVEVTDGSITVEEFKIEDDDVVEYFSENEDHSPEELLRLAVKMGVSNLRLSETSKEVEYIRHEFEKINRDIQDEVDGLRDELENWFGGEDGEFAEIIDETFGKNGDIVDEVFDHNKEDTPIGELYKDIETELQGLREKFIEEEARQEVEEKAPIKGENFEDDLENLLESLIQKSDTLRRTGDEHGQIDDRFVGDFVVTLGETQQDIVIEAKNVGRIGKPDIREELEEGMENRGADYGILVLRDEEASPQSLGSFDEFGENMLYVAISDESSDTYDRRILELAYEWARMRTISDQLDVTDEVDPDTIQTMIEEAEDELGRFKNIRSQCTNIEKARKKVQEELDEIEDEIQERLNVINTEISESAS